MTKLYDAEMFLCTLQYDALEHHLFSTLGEDNYDEVKEQIFELYARSNPVIYNTLKKYNGKINDNFSLREIVKKIKSQYHSVYADSLSVGKKREHFYGKILAGEHQQLISDLSSTSDLEKDLFHAEIGVCFIQLKELQKGVAHLEKALSINPTDQLANFFLGQVNLHKGNFQTAAAHFFRIKNCSPFWLETLSYLILINQKNSGNEFQNIMSFLKEKRFSESEITSVGNTLFRSKAYGPANDFMDNKLKDDESGIIHSNYGAMLLLQKEFIRSAKVLSDGLKRFPQCKKIKTNISAGIQAGVKFDYETHEVLLDEYLIRPSDVVVNIFNQIKSENWFRLALDRSTAAQSLNYILNEIDHTNVVRFVLSATAIPSLEFEKVFKNLRSAILNADDETVRSNSSVVEVLASYSFNTDYVCEPDDNELDKLKHLLNKIKANPNDVDAKSNTLKVSLYLNILEVMSTDKALCTLSEPLVELLGEFKAPYASGLGSFLQNPQNIISKKVKAQYEDSPYPKWRSGALAVEKKSLVDLLESKSINCEAFIEKEPTKSEHNILVAGCGTGQQPIELASKVNDSMVTAIDICGASLAYANKKSIEHRITNLTFQACDILDVHQLETNFDYIECVGVLHHMEDPMHGLKLLVNKLRRGGVIRLGLYSEIARAPIYKYRKTVGMNGASLKQVREERENILKGVYGDKFLSYISSFRDFYNLSEFRDLLFHASDRAYSLPVISDMLTEVDIKFCSFNLPKTTLEKIQIPEKSLTDLSLHEWHGLELTYSDMFKFMYDFYCQKN
jgi:2-polyprenyl-3-methyl-5-hydroxy-6-metoxy-1,4-benzoquinol methylase